MKITTSRTILRPWRGNDLPAFAALHADPEVMRDANGPISRAQSEIKLRRYRAAFDAHGFCRWAVDDHVGNLIGYAGVNPIPSDSPMAPGFDVGWRFVRRAWGKGLATEAAAAALADVFARTELNQILSFTAPDNVRSQAVMRKLNLRRDETRDFVVEHDGLRWTGLVWVADRGWTRPASLR
jgi:RimJ/RimL family protein N-acetyltransferase